MEFVVTRASDWGITETKMTFNSLEELAEFALKEKQRLVIDFSDYDDCFKEPKDRTIVVYDDYIE